MMHEEIPVVRILPLALVTLLVATPALQTSRGAAAKLPARVESYVAGSVRLTPAERTRLTGGAPITKMLDVDETKEVSVFGATWINAPMGRYVEVVKDIENLERGGGFKVTRRISEPPRLEDFAHMHLSQEDVGDLRTCRVGSCEVKLGEEALKRFQTDIDWNGPNVRAAADALMQQLAFEYVTGYLEGGNERLAVYRDKSRPTFVAHEFRGMVDQMPELTTYMPNMRRYLLEYPKEKVPDSTSFLYWQETVFGLKPTIRISHLTIREGPDDTVVASKMLYASHYFWTGLEVRALVPDPARGPGFWFITVSRSRSDGLSGFIGRFVRGRVRSEVQKGALASLQSTRRVLEGKR